MLACSHLEISGVGVMARTGVRVCVCMRASVSVTAEGEDTSNEVEGGVFSESVFFPQL